VVVRVAAVLIAGVLTTACSEPALVEQPVDDTDPVGTDGSPTPIEALMVTSGPGLSRPLAPEQIDHVFLTIHVAHSYNSGYGDLGRATLGNRFALSKTARELGYSTPSTPSSSTECGGCTRREPAKSGRLA
jgi:hypothetical protein